MVPKQTQVRHKTTDGLTTYHRFDDKENLTAIILCLEFQTVRGVQ